MKARTGLKPNAVQNIAGLCQKVEQDVITMRHALHQIPEASFHEEKTRAAVSSYLKKAGIRFESGVGGLGVVGLIQGGGAQGGGARGSRSATRPRSSQARTVELEGTIRTKKESTRRKVTAMVKQVLDATCAAFGAQGEFEYVKGYPGVHCDEHFSQEVRAACSEILGRSRVVRTAGFEMGGEDFAYYAEKVPGTIVSVGVGNKKQGKIHRLHHPKFDIDEAALKVGVCALAYSAYHHLNRDTPHLKTGMDPIDRSPDEVG